jgi:predicted SnoaL-like aldol condensation-catalyzing enzyme
MTAKGLVDQATSELFERGQMANVDRYWSADYIEHSTISGPGLDGMHQVARTLPEGFQYDKVRLLGDADLVVVHGVYHEPGADPSVGFDVWRVAGGMIVEHWDARQPWVGANPSGHSMIDGPTAVTHLDKTADNRRLVKEFVELIMMGGDRSQLPRFFEGDQFIQHNPLISDGLSGLGDAIQTGVWAAVVERCYRVVAEGEFVFTQGEGTLRDAPTAFYDLFRVDNGKLAEHWDVVFAQPATLPHSNGLF